ncbi:hypothetical protein BJ742DRAFT_796069 [Cladochytrium replicatum]|nr:hypothetical protein BJ742DRAFT_796069 [Cladochytrium replicatum]
MTISDSISLLLINATRSNQMQAQTFDVLTGQRFVVNLRGLRDQVDEVRFTAIDGLARMPPWLSFDSTTWDLVGLPIRNGNLSAASTRIYIAGYRSASAPNKIAAEINGSMPSPRYPRVIRGPPMVTMYLCINIDGNHPPTPANATGNVLRGILLRDVIGRDAPSATVGVPYEFSVPTWMIQDEDGDPLKYRAVVDAQSRANDSTPGSWLAFDSRNLSFNGVPVVEGITSFFLIAIDPQGSMARIRINVTSLPQSSSPVIFNATFTTDSPLTIPTNDAQPESSTSIPPPATDPTQYSASTAPHTESTQTKVNGGQTDSGFPITSTSSAPAPYVLPLAICLGVFLSLILVGICVGWLCFAKKRRKYPMAKHEELTPPRMTALPPLPASLFAAGKRATAMSGFAYSNEVDGWNPSKLGNGILGTSTRQNQTIRWLDSVREETERAYGTGRNAVELQRDSIQIAPARDSRIVIDGLVDVDLRNSPPPRLAPPFFLPNRASLMTLRDNTPTISPTETDASSGSSVHFEAFQSMSEDEPFSDTVSSRSSRISQLYDLYLHEWVPSALQSKNGSMFGYRDRPTY